MDKPLTLGLVAALLMAGGQANAASADAIIYSNLGPGDTYGNGGSVLDQYNVEKVSEATVETAAAFTPSGNFTLTQIVVGITHAFGTNSIMLSLEGSNSHGLPDGTPLDSFTLTGLPAVSTCPSFMGCVIQPSQIVKPTSSVELLENTEYWLVATPPPVTTSSEWVMNSTGATGGVARRITPFFGNDFFLLPPDSTTPAFEVLGTPVGAPEPATLGLMVLGLLGGAGFAGRKRRN